MLLVPDITPDRYKGGLSVGTIGESVTLDSVIRRSSLPKAATDVAQGSLSGECGSRADVLYFGKTVFANDAALYQLRAVKRPNVPRVLAGVKVVAKP